MKLNEYLDYMANLLQRKRNENDYVFRVSNPPRHQSKECIWDNPDLVTSVKELMVQEFEYFNFCHHCVGSEDDLLVAAP